MQKKGKNFLQWKNCNEILKTETNHIFLFLFSKCSTRENFKSTISKREKSIHVSSMQPLLTQDQSCFGSTSLSPPLHPKHKITNSRSYYLFTNTVVCISEWHKLFKKHNHGIIISSNKSIIEDLNILKYLVCVQIFLIA